MMKKVWAIVVALAALSVLTHFFGKPVLASVRAALVQNVDEPGRNPYQETEFDLSCSNGANPACNVDFAAVPAGKRLVVPHVNGFVDVVGGTLPNMFLSSSLGGSQYATVFFQGERGTKIPTSTRIVINQPINAYFGAGEVPHIFSGLY